MSAWANAIRSRAWITIILVTAFILRVYHISYQSLWLDELHLMIEANPSISWKELLHYLQCCDLQPPVYFIIERTAFRLFGYNEFVARMVTAIGGTLSVGAMYLLGKEISGKRLGLLCAALTCVNFYNIHYSQDARPYIFSFLFATLSFAFFVRALKRPTLRNGLYYSLWTLVFLYTHYYSLFAVMAQGVLALLFLFQEQGKERRVMLKLLLINGGIIAAAYALWLPVLSGINQSEHTWIPVPEAGFVQAYTTDYFGNEGLLQPILLFLITAFFINVTIICNKETPKKINYDPLLRCFLVVFVWILISYLIPFVMSRLSAPLLFPRYTIVVLPAFILIVAYGIELFKAPVIRNALLAGFLAISVINLFLVKRYYSSVSKTQFREMTAFLVTENKKAYPVINELTHWHQGYYLRKYNSHAELWTGKKEDLIDSVVHKSSGKYAVEGFWIVGAHGDEKPDSLSLELLRQTYELKQQKDFFDAWAMFYQRRAAAQEPHQPAF